MKNTNPLVGAIKCLAGLALACVLGLTQSQAANIKYEVKVPGYTQRGNGWALVLPELRSTVGGKVVWDSARGCYVTDRVQRGEVMRITISASTPTEKCTRIAAIGIAPGDENYLDRVVRLPYVIDGFVVSRNPDYDNVSLNVTTLTRNSAGGWELVSTSKRIPIGSR